MGRSNTGGDVADRITLANSEFEGHNNVYVLEDDGLALVDTAVATPPTESTLADELSARGYEFADVEAIVLTHYHPDHAGLAGTIQAESDATVYVHEADASLVANGTEAWTRLERRRVETLEHWGTPEAKREELGRFLERARGIAGEPVDLTPLTDGETITVAGYDLKTVHTPGHTAGHCAFEFRNRGAGRHEAFVGDALLPVYTPNIGGADVRVSHPLATYLETLGILIDREYDRVWPGHRDPITDPASRVRTIYDHHRERTANVIDVLRESGPADPWTVSAHLFGDLEGIHILHGPGEAAAHLDHLHQEGVATYTDGIYELLEPEVAVAEIVPPLTR